MITYLRWKQFERGHVIKQLDRVFYYFYIESSINK